MPSEIWGMAKTHMHVNTHYKHVRSYTYTHTLVHIEKHMCARANPMQKWMGLHIVHLIKKMTHSIFAILASKQGGAASQAWQGQVAHQS